MSQPRHSNGHNAAKFLRRGQTMTALKAEALRCSDTQATTRGMQQAKHELFRRFNPQRRALPGPRREALRAVEMTGPDDDVPFSRHEPPTPNCRKGALPWLRLSRRRLQVHLSMGICQDWPTKEESIEPDRNSCIIRIRHSDGWFPR